MICHKTENHFRGSISKYLVNHVVGLQDECLHRWSNSHVEPCAHMSNISLRTQQIYWNMDREQQDKNNHTETCLSGRGHAIALVRGFD